MDENKEHPPQPPVEQVDSALEQIASPPEDPITTWIVAHRWWLVCLSILAIAIRLEVGLAEAQSDVDGAEYEARKAVEAVDDAQRAVKGVDSDLDQLIKDLNLEFSRSYFRRR